jgi:hypothetical protein
LKINDPILQFGMLTSLVKTILENANTYKWSLQGMGMLRLHLPGDLRIHVWDQRYAVPDVSMVHDHLQWGLESQIISGCLTNYRYVPATDGEQYFYATLKAGYGCYFKHDPVPIRLRALPGEHYSAGQSYAQAPSEIHRSDPENGTVTLMQKQPSDDPESARVFWLAGEKWVSAEPREATVEEVHDIVGYALANWSPATA